MKEFAQKSVVGYDLKAMSFFPYDDSLQITKFQVISSFVP